MTFEDCEAFRRDALTQPEVLGWQARLSWGPDSPELPSDPARAGDILGHRDNCDACSAWLRRQRQVVGLLGSVERYSAPDELGSRVMEVVAANRRRDTALESLVEQRTPEVLRRLVKEEVEAGASASIARSIYGLGRLQAPVELDDLVATRLESDQEFAPRAAAASLANSGPVDQPTPLGSPARLIADNHVDRARALRFRIIKIVSAAAVVALIARSIDPLLESGERELPEPRVQMIVVTSPDALGPFAGVLVAGLSGGLTNATKLEDPR